MLGYNEIVARLVIIASIVMIVETRARYIYQPGPFLECEQMKIPCGGHSKETCNEYCESNGFVQGSCNGHCCLCIARPRGMLHGFPFFRQPQHSVQMPTQIPTKMPTPTTTTNKQIMTFSTASAQSTVTGLQTERSDLDHNHDDDKLELLQTVETHLDIPVVNNNNQQDSKPKRYAAIDGNPIFTGSDILNSLTNDDKKAAGRPSLLSGLNVHSPRVSQVQIKLPALKEAKHDDTCVTPECVKTANDILENLDESVSPCDDFYEFVCGNFQKDQPIPDDKGSVTLMGSIDDTLTEKLKTMLDEEILNKTDLTYSARLAKTLYDSCRNSDLLESSGVAPLHELLNTLGGWPVLEGDSWNESSFNWQKTIGNLRKSGLISDYLLKVSVMPDFKNPSRRILSVAEPLLSINKEQLRNPIFMEAYRKYQVDVAVLLGANRTQAEAEMFGVFQFERNLANISLPRELSRAHPLNFYHPTTIAELQTLFPSVEWLNYVNTLLSPDDKFVGVDENQVINVHLPEQLKILLNLIKGTDRRVLANYLMWRVSSAVLPYLNEGAMQVQQNFVASFTGRTMRKPRWRECVDIASQTLGQAIGAMYVRKHFDEEAKEVALEMVNDIRDSFVDILVNMDWMDEETKKRAFEKLSAMKTNIGYPKELLEELNLINLYDGLVLSPDNFFGNILNLTKGAADYSMKKLKQPVNKKDWVQFGKPAMVNAFYQPTTNSIQFPAGILQGHFFNKERPAFMNYGAIGWVIGHEITHGYDDQGSHFDATGDLRDWWEPKTKHLFHGKAKCLVEQYGKFTYTDSLRNFTIPINGIISVGENIADNGGIKQAYSGYQAWIKRNGNENKLPGLKYTPNQLFWISAATNWCSKVRPQQMMESIQMGVHAPGPYRVRGTFANIDQFAKDFSCPVGTPMNPVTKCTVW